MGSPATPVLEDRNTLDKETDIAQKQKTKTKTKTETSTKTVL
jgi:hypothetical protein